jgi:hypothetical protein
VYRTLAELAAAERISRSSVCRVVRLTRLAPDMVDRILPIGGRLLRSRGSWSRGSRGVCQHGRVAWRVRLLNRVPAGPWAQVGRSARAVVAGG